MKKLVGVISITAILFLVFSCKKEQDSQLSKEKVQFLFDQTILKSISSDSILNPYAIVVSVEDLSGTVLYDSEQILFYNMNGSYISNPISLIPGTYHLTKFLIVDIANNVLYATPLVGSKKAYLVNNPLPISFIVKKNNVTSVIPEVINTRDINPTDLGYTTFSLKIVNTFKFLIDVFDFNEQTKKFQLTTAHFSILAGKDSIYKIDLTAKVNSIILKEVPGRFILEVTKSGFKIWKDTLTADQLSQYTGNVGQSPLKVLLEKGCNCPSTIVDADGNIYHTVIINSQCWMVENLKVTHLNDGSPLSNITDSANWMNNTNPAYCWYNNDILNKQDYGGLYNGYAVHCGKLAPVGWHVQTTQDFINLTNYFGSTKINVGDFMETGNVHWQNTSQNTNNNGFTALPGGVRDEFSSNRGFFSLGSETTWWCSDEYNTQSGSLKFNSWNIDTYDSNNPQLGLRYNPTYTPGFSVRCIKD